MLKQLALILGMIIWAVPALAEERPASFADLVEKLSPAVVNISTTQKLKGGGVQMFGLPFDQMPNTPEMEPFRDFFERFGGRGGKNAPEREVTSLGSGFVIDAKGYVITNNHVIDAADSVMVIFSDNTKYKATIVGKDKKTDLALLKIEPKKDLPFVTMGDSDAMRVGDWVIAIGNPFGLGGSVTQGIISARARSINAGPFDDFLQTDAPINRGNSGGPLFNTKGEVIGINSAIFSPSGGSVGIGFAIPTALAKPVVEQLKQYGRTHRGWLGVKIQEVSEEVADSVGLPKPYGALVLDVSKGGPAEKAGIKAGDVITQYDGKEVSEMRHLPRLVAESKKGASVKITYWRKNAAQTATITVGELDEAAADDGEEGIPGKVDKPKSKASGETVLGMELTPVTPMAREEFKLDDAASGLVVMDVEANSEAAKRGMRPGDVIKDVNSEPVKSVEEFKKSIDAAKKAGRKFALVHVVRARDEAFITLPTSEERK